MTALQETLVDKLSAKASADVQSLRKDGFDVKRAFADSEGRYVIFAEAARKDHPLPVFCADASPYALGHAIATCCPKLVKEMATTYLEHVVPTFVSERCDRFISDSPVLKPLLRVFSTWLLHLAHDQREQSSEFLAANCPRMCAEIAGLSAGLVESKSVDMTLAEVGMRLWAVNLAADVLALLLNRGQLHTSFMACLARVFATDLASKSKYAALLRRMLHEFGAAEGKGHGSLDDLLGTGMGMGCDSFGVRCQKTKRVSFARDFQLPNGRVFQRAACIRILKTTRGRCVFQSGAVGVCGGVTSARLCAKTGHFLCTGVNMLRAQWATDTATSALSKLPPLGVPCMAVVDAVAFQYDGPYMSSSIAAFIAEIPRAASWIFPVSTDGDSGVLETVGRVLTSMDAAVAVAHAGISCLATKVLVSRETLRHKCSAHTKGPCWYSNGSAFRSMEFHTPSMFQSLNETLFSARAPATEQAHAKEICDRVLNHGVMRPAAWIGTNYFPYTGAGSNDLVIASNSALVPLMRAFQMRTAPDRATTLTSRGIEWRYIHLYKKVCQLQKQPEVTLKGVAQAITFLDPKKSKYWWPKDRTEAHGEDVPVEGTINLVWAGAKMAEVTFGHKSGTWACPWTLVHCAQYLGGNDAQTEAK